MGKKRGIRQRDSEATRRKLLDAVSVIMREEGFAGLGTNSIARFIGRDKNLIRYHFSGLAGLQKAYIREKDYWPPFFERFSLSEGSSAFEIEQLFVELMQENLRFFHGDFEMQKIILWQISEESALLRSISEAREADGEKLLGLTDKFFRGTDVNFRSVIALLLGGVYYMVLHANTNKSVVCGIDVNLEKDRSDVLRTIGQIVSWSFRQVDDGLGSAGIAVGSGDGYSFGLLENLVSRFARFVAGGRSDASFAAALEAEVVRLDGVLEHRLFGISDPVQLSSFVRVSLFRLSKIADGLYLDHEREHPEALLVLPLLERLTDAFSDLVPIDLVLPKVLWMSWCDKLGGPFERLEQLLEGLGFGSAMDGLILAPFLRFFRERGEMDWGDLVYLGKYARLATEGLENMGVADRDAILLLVRLNRNDEGVLKGYVEDAGVRMDGFSVPSRRGFLLSQKQRISQAEELDMAYVPGARSAKMQLLSWLDGELAALPEITVATGNLLKFSSGLKVTELSYLMKLLYDQGIWGKVKLDVFVQQVAHNFASVSGGDISPGSIKSKLYPKDAAVISVVEQLLVEMLETLRSGM